MALMCKLVKLSSLIVYIHQRLSIHNIIAAKSSLPMLVFPCVEKEKRQTDAKGYAI